MNEHPYRVVVTREDGAWLADVPGLDGAHTYAHTPPALDRAVRERAGELRHRRSGSCRLASRTPSGHLLVFRPPISNPLQRQRRRLVPHIQRQGPEHLG